MMSNPSFSHSVFYSFGESTCMENFLPFHQIRNCRRQTLSVWKSEICRLGCEILEFPSVINFDIITSDNISFHFHFLL